MKRTPELRTLSEDHHHGPVQARRLRLTGEGGETRGAEPVARGFLDFWQKDTPSTFAKKRRSSYPWWHGTEEICPASPS